MNEILQKHGCSNVFSVPEGLKELMSDITREVLREQPPNICDFISNYLSVMMITREHGIMAVKILDDLCDCKPSVSQHLIQLGIEEYEAQSLAEIIKEEIESQPADGKETIKEFQIVKRILIKSALDEVMMAKVCNVARNAYRDYWYRKKTLEKSLKMKPEEPWETAAQHTLEIYKRTKPSLSELTRATEKIQAAYRGYHVRRNLLRHLKPKQKKKGPKVNIPGPPLDIAGSREFELGPLLSINVREDNVNAMFEEDTTEKLGLQYDPLTTITHLTNEDYDEVLEYPEIRRNPSQELKPPSPGDRSQTQYSIAPTMMINRISGPHQDYVVNVSSSWPSHISQENNALHKISFSKVSPELIPNSSTAMREDDQEIKEELADDGTDTEEKEDEVPEDIAVSGDEGESVHSTSVPTTHDTDDDGELLDLVEEEG